MVTLAIVTSFILTIVFRLKKRQLEAKGGKRLTYHFIDKSLEFLVPFTIISSLFFLLSLFVENTSNSTTIQSLVFLEKLISFFKWFVSIFKVGALVAVCLLIIFYLLSLTRIPSKYTGKLLPFFKKYQKVVKTAYMLVIILFSFTFFGTQTGKPEARLRFRINEAQGKYGELQQEVKETIAKEVAKKLIEKVENSVPPDYREDLKEQNEFYFHLSQLSATYETFKSNYGGRDPGAEIFVNNPPPPDPPPSPHQGGDDGGGGGSGGKSKNKGVRPSDPSAGEAPATAPDKAPRQSAVEADAGKMPERAMPGERIVYEVFEAAEPTMAQARPAPAQASTEKILQAKQAVRDYRVRVQEEAVRILKSEHGGELAVQLPKVITGKLKELIFKGLTDRYPVLEPIVGALFGAVDKDLGDRTQRAAERAANTLAQNPENAMGVIREEASKVVDETKISFATALLNKGRGAVAALRKKAQGMIEAVTRLNERGQRLSEIAAAAAEADGEIQLLSCMNEQRRIEAAAKLAKASPNLTQTQVERIKSLLQEPSAVSFPSGLHTMTDVESIVSVLRGNEYRLRKSVTESNAYEFVPVQYYAALAVRGMRSPYLTEGAQEEATRIIAQESATARLGSRYTYPADLIERGGLVDT